jgi:O-antigen/teichoic acid export membrane protein
LVSQPAAASTKFLANGSFARGVSQLAVGNCVSQVATLAAMPLLTRLYSAEEFGVLGIFSTALGLFTVVSSLRYEMAITLPKRDSAAFQIMGLCFFCLILSTSLVALCGAGIGQRLLSGVGAGEITAYYWLLPAGGFLAGLYQLLTCWGVRRKAYGPLARTRVQQGVGSIAVQAALGMMQFGGIGLLLGHVVGQAAGVLGLARNTAADYLKQRTRITIRGMRGAAGRYSEFPRFDSWAVLLNTASAALPVAFFAFLFGPKLVGFYALGFKLLSAPVSLLGKSLSQVLLPRAGEAVREKNLDQLVTTVLRLLTLSSLTPFFIAAIIAPRLFGVLFGSGWIEAGEIASYTSLWVAWQFIYSPLSVILLAVEAQRTNLLIQAVSFVLRALAIGAGYLIGSQYLAVCFFSAMSVATYVFGLILVIKCSGVETRIFMSVAAAEVAVSVLTVTPLFIARQGSILTLMLVALPTCCVWGYRLRKEVSLYRLMGRV